MSCGVSSRAMSPAPGVTAPSISGMRNLTDHGRGGAGGDAGGTASAPPPASAVAGGNATARVERGIIRPVPGRSTDSFCRPGPCRGAAQLPPEAVPEGRDLGEEALRLRAGAAALGRLRLEL